MSASFDSSPRVPSALRASMLIARSVLVEAIRRREIYAIVLVSVVVIGAVMTVDFFGLEGLEKFYREIALRVMSVASALAAIALATRQLPREFESRTIYPLLAKPVGRGAFLLGKLFGVLLAAGFCLAIFMGIYLAGVLYLGGFAAFASFPWVGFAQYVVLQMLLLLVLSTLGFLLSMLFNVDAAISMATVFYLMSPVVTTATTVLYDPVRSTAFEKGGLLFLAYAAPQLTLFDVSQRTVHEWAPLSPLVMGAVVAYGLAYSALYAGAAMLLFRRKPL